MPDDSFRYKTADGTWQVVKTPYYKHSDGTWKQVKKFITNTQMELGSKCI